MKLFKVAHNKLLPTILIKTMTKSNALQLIIEYNLSHTVSDIFSNVSFSLLAYATVTHKTDPLWQCKLRKICILFSGWPSA